MLNRYSVRLYEEIPDYLMPQFMSNFIKIKEAHMKSLPEN
jgi:hypothetical protein